MKLTVYQMVLFSMVFVSGLQEVSAQYNQVPSPSGRIEIPRPANINGTPSGRVRIPGHVMRAAIAQAQTDIAVIETAGASASEAQLAHAATLRSMLLRLGAVGVAGAVGAAVGDYAYENFLAGNEDFIEATDPLFAAISEFIDMLGLGGGLEIDINLSGGRSDEELAAAYPLAFQAIGNMDDFRNVSENLLALLQERLERAATWQEMVDATREFLAMNQVRSALSSHSATSTAAMLFDQFDVNSRNGESQALETMLAEMMSRAENAFRNGEH